MTGERRRKPWAVGSLLLMGLAAGILPVACRTADDAPAAEQPATPPGEVRLEPNDPRLAYLTLDTVAPRIEKVVAVLPAQLVVDEDHTARIASPVTGRVRTLDAQLGDPVHAGQPLAHIASSDVAQAESDLLKSQAALSQASAGLYRARDLYRNQVIALRTCSRPRATKPKRTRSGSGPQPGSSSSALPLRRCGRRLSSARRSTVRWSSAI